MSVKVKSDICTGCETCVSVCPFGAIEMKDGKAFITEACTMCGACVEACEFKAIEKDIEADRSRKGPLGLQGRVGLRGTAQG